MLKQLPTIPTSQAIYVVLSDFNHPDIKFKEVLEEFSLFISDYGFCKPDTPQVRSVAPDTREDLSRIVSKIRIRKYIKIY